MTRHDNKTLEGQGNLQRNLKHGILGAIFTVILGIFLKAAQVGEQFNKPAGLGGYFIIVGIEVIVLLYLLKRYYAKHRGGIVSMRTTIAPVLKEEKLRKFNRNCNLTNLIAWSMFAFTVAALVISRMLKSEIFFYFPVILLGGAFLLMLYQFFELAWWLHSMWVPIKFAMFTMKPIGPVPKLILRMGEAGVLMAFFLLFIPSFIGASKFMDAASASSPIINYFGIILTTYMYCALIALLILSVTMRLEGFGALEGEFVQNALRKNMFFYVACVGLMVIDMVLVIL